MELITLSPGNMRSPKEVMKYIFDGYKNTRPEQSNIFRTIISSYRGDMMDNTGNIENQQDAIVRSLTDIYARYEYTDVTVTIVFVEESNSFEIDIKGTDNLGVTTALSESVIFTS